MGQARRGTNRRRSSAAMRLALGFLAAFCLISAVHAAPAGKPLRILLLTGKNNHAWQETTPVLKDMYEASGRFAVDILYDPSTMDSRSLAGYDVIVSNWTNYPSADREWGPKAEKAFLDFVRSGKGFVLVHAAGACFQGWPEYRQLAGAVWGSKSAHGTYHAFNVVADDPDHPVTKVIGDFVITDELYHRMDVEPTAHRLCSGFSDKAEGGTGEWEPAVFSTSFGAGRGFYQILGHDAKAMMNPNWKLLMLRGTEWAATGRATIEIPFDIAAVVKAAALTSREQSREPQTVVHGLVCSAYRNPGLRGQLARTMAALLQSPGSEEFKKFMCGELGIIGTPAEVPALARLLEDPKLGFAACSALERIPGAEASKALQDSTARLRGAALVGIINSLGERRDASAVDMLGAYLRAAGDKDVIAAAIRALGKIGGPQAVKAMEAGRTAIPSELHPELAASLLECAEGLESSGDGNSAAPIYRSLYDPGLPSVIRSAACLGEMRSSKDRAAPLLLEALTSSDEARQMAAIRFLAMPQGKGSARAAASRLLSLPEQLQPQLIDALAAAGDRSVLPEIHRALESSSRATRLAAVDAMPLLGDASSAQRLLDLAGSAQAVELAAIRKSLARMPGADVDKALTAAVTNPSSPAIKREAIIALATRGFRPSVPVILKAATAESGEVRHEAIKALGVLAGGEESPALVEILTSAPSADDRAAIADALVAIGRRAQTPDQIIDAVLATLPGATSEAKEQLFRVLAGFGGASALEAVRAALKSADAETRNAALRSLSDWPDASPLDDLAAVARSSRDAVSKTLALRAIANLAKKANEIPADDRAATLGQALAIADTPETKKLLLGVLGGIPSLRALDLARANLDRPEVSEEAAAALTSISKALLAQRFRGETGMITVAVITGGHDFELVPFLRLFAAQPDITFLHLPQSDDSEIFENISRWPFDVVILYNLTQKISAARRENFLRLLDQGVGVFALHHAMGSFQDWPQYQKIIGARYHLAAGEADGKKFDASTYLHGVKIAVHVADASHPVSLGLKDFTVTDETYKGSAFEPDIRILLTTTEPTSDKPLCWVRNYRHANVCGLQLGHGAEAFASPSYRKLTAQAIRWCAAPRLEQRKTAPEKTGVGR